MDTVIISGVISAIIIPFIAPFALDFLACLTIYFMNKKNGRPTWKRGTKFAEVAWPSGYTLYGLKIVNVSFKFVTLKNSDGIVQVKKRDMLKLVTVIA
jgi:hypothetical protein